MNFIWAGSREKINNELKFSINLNGECDLLKVCAADFFKVIGDGKYICYGPSRTAANYTRPKLVNVKGVKQLDVYVLAYNVATYSCDMQLPFFGAEVYKENKVVYNSLDFSVCENSARDLNSPRYSSQRGFMENYDFTAVKDVFLKPYPVDNPTELETLEEVCDYNLIIPKKLAVSNAKFDNVCQPSWYKKELYAPKKTDFSVEKDFLKKVKKGEYACEDYYLDQEKTAVFKFDITAREESEIFVAFDEMISNGWNFRRSGCNDLIRVKVPVGKTEFFGSEPYAFKYLKLFYKGDVDVSISLVLIENNRIIEIDAECDEKLSTIFSAASNTFKQNVLDIFMDCPGRERAGWLCDSYFMAKAEKLFTGKNDVEKAFIYNFLISDTPEIEKDMFPKCFPSEHSSKLYIPNWAMWLVVELKDYLTRTGDRELIDVAKERVYKLVKFFDKYVNEYGLLENLESWVFIEWSVCNTKPYIKGVNFPSNMLFAYMLDAIYDLYGDIEFKERAEKIKKTVKELSFNGEFFVDNAVRKRGKLKRVDKHVSETCQYYALFTNIECDKAFKDNIIKEFGPKRTTAYPKIGKSNMFIGNYLRLLWLKDIGENERVLSESVDYFYNMAKTTGTLWEHNKPHASCNHGFTAVIAVILLEVLNALKKN